MKKALLYTSEELKSFIDNKNYKTFRSYYLIYKAEVKLFFRFFKASCIGYIRYYLRRLNLFGSN